MIRHAPTLFLLCLLFVAGARANPWLPPGDERVRDDILRLADAGILRGPVTTWPLSWPDVARDVQAASAAGLDAATSDALFRIQRLSREASAHGFSGIGYRASVSHDPAELRTFADSPRDTGEIAAGASWLSSHVALNLQGTVVTDPDDDKTWRADGSYLGVNVGNFMISAGYMERWWGPGWEGSLILSTNARPIPSITIERNYTDPFRTRLLSWLGPWRASIAVGEAEAHDVAVPRVRFLATRVNFRPRPWLDVGLSRTAQWCGGDRPCGFKTFTDMLIGHDNQEVNGAPADNQPGNQMAGYDVRLRSPWRRLPVAVYTQWIGEDEAGGLPSKFLGQFGAESWFATALGGLRVRAEYSDTACNFTRDAPEFGCAYRNTIYPQGYTYRGRVIGHAMDQDGRMLSAAALLTLERGDSFSVMLRRADINRDGADNAISDVPLRLKNVELRYTTNVGLGALTIGAGYDDRVSAGGSSAGAHGFVNWQQGL